MTVPATTSHATSPRQGRSRRAPRTPRPPDTESQRHEVHQDPAASARRIRSGHRRLRLSDRGQRGELPRGAPDPEGSSAARRNEVGAPLARTGQGAMCLPRRIPPGAALGNFVVEGRVAFPAGGLRLRQRRCRRYRSGRPTTCDLRRTRTSGSAISVMLDGGQRFFDLRVADPLLVCKLSDDLLLAPAAVQPELPKLLDHDHRNEIAWLQQAVGRSARSCRKPSANQVGEGMAIGPGERRIRQQKARERLSRDRGRDARPGPAPPALQPLPKSLRLQPRAPRQHLALPGR